MAGLNGILGRVDEEVVLDLLLPTGILLQTTLQVSVLILGGDFGYLCIVVFALSPAFVLFDVLC